MLTVPFVNLGLQQCLIEKELLDAIRIVLESGQFILGDEVLRFEQHFAERVGARYAIGVNSGTDSLLLTMKALNIGPGDEVITVPNSFLATVAVIELLGASSVFVDVTEDQTMDITQVEAAITPRTRAVIPVHLTGRPAPMPALLEIAARYHLVVIEDRAQAIGASLDGRQVGTFGIASAFSLHPLKNLAACGDGGVIVTNDDTLNSSLRKLRNHGLISRDECAQWGFNSRLDAIQAAILNVKLRHLERWTQRRRAIAGRYCHAFADLPLHLPREEEGQVCVYHAFVIQTDERDALQAYLASREIETKIHYPIPIHKQQAATRTRAGQRNFSFPVAERQAEHILSLPIYPELTDEQVEWVIAGLRGYLQRSS